MTKEQGAIPTNVEHGTESNHSTDSLDDSAAKKSRLRTFPRPRGLIIYRDSVWFQKAREKTKDDTPPPDLT